MITQLNRLIAGESTHCPSCLAPCEMKAKFKFKHKNASGNLNSNIYLEVGYMLEHP